MKVLPIVLLPWLLSKRAWRAAAGYGLCLVATFVTLTLPHRGALPGLWHWAHIFHLLVVGVLLLSGCLGWRLWRGRRADGVEVGASSRA